MDDLFEEHRMIMAILASGSVATSFGTPDDMRRRLSSIEAEIATYIKELEDELVCRDEDANRSRTLTMCSGCQRGYPAKYMVITGGDAWCQECAAAKIEELRRDMGNALALARRLEDAQ